MEREAARVPRDRGRNKNKWSGTRGPGRGREKKETLSGGCKKFTASPTALLFKGMIPPVSTLLEGSLFGLKLSRVLLPVTATLMPRLLCLFLLFLSISVYVHLSLALSSDFPANLPLSLSSSASISIYSSPSLSRSLITSLRLPFILPLYLRFP